MLKINRECNSLGLVSPCGFYQFAVERNQNQIIFGPASLSSKADEFWNVHTCG